MTPWELEPIGWEAIATLITGCLAVRAASKIGRRQNKIANAVRDLEEQKVKIDLFEQRLAIYRQTKFWLDNFYTPLEKLPDGTKTDFLKYRDEALFLFGQKMFDQMQKWLDDKAYYHGSVGQDRNGIVGAATVIQNIGETIERDKANLRNIFGPWLDLSKSF